MIKQMIGRMTFEELEAAERAAVAFAKSVAGDMIRGEMREALDVIIKETDEPVTQDSIHRHNFNLGQKAALAKLTREIFGLPDMIAAAKETKRPKE